MTENHTTAPAFDPHRERYVGPMPHTRLTNIGFISSLIALSAYSGALVSALSAFTETFRIEDLAAEAHAAGVNTVNGISLFECFRPPPGQFFLNHFGTALALIAITATILAVIALRPRDLAWPLVVVIAVIAAAVLGFTVIFPAGLIGLVGIVELAALATALAKKLTPPRVILQY